MQKSSIRLMRMWDLPGWGVMVIAAVFLVSGCGYHFTSGGRFPKDVHSVYVAPLVNKTLDVGLGKEMGTALKAAFRRGGSVVVVEELEAADAILTGIVRKMEARVVAVNDKDEAIEYETMLVTDMSLRRRSPDEVLWRGQGGQHDFGPALSGLRGFYRRHPGSQPHQRHTYFRFYGYTVDRVPSPAGKNAIDRSLCPGHSSTNSGFVLGHQSHAQQLIPVPGRGYGSGHRVLGGSNQPALET